MTPLRALFRRTIHRSVIDLFLDYRPSALRSTANPARLSVMAALWACIHSVPASATEYISRDEWPEIQRGIQVTQYAKLAGVVNEFDRARSSNQDSNIVVLYPGGEAGYRWAVEIRDWFVALGIPARKIALRPGSGVPGSLGLRVEDQGFK